MYPSLQGGETSKEQELSQEQYNSALPFLPPLSEKTLRSYYTAYASMVAGIIAFGALVAPILEVKLGLGGEGPGRGGRRRCGCRLGRLAWCAIRCASRVWEMRGGRETGAEAKAEVRDGRGLGNTWCENKKQSWNWRGRTGGAWGMGKAGRGGQGACLLHGTRC